MSQVVNPKHFDDFGSFDILHGVVEEIAKRGDQAIFTAFEKYGYSKDYIISHANEFRIEHWLSNDSKTFYHYDEKLFFSQYTAENLIAKRESLSESVKENTAADLASFGIAIVSIAIEDIDFTDAFTNAVEAKQVAAQNKLTAQTQQEQKTMEERAAAERAKIAAQADADKAIIAANADLEVVKVQAEAALYAGEKEAEMNKRISESLTGELTNYYWIKQWNGELPSTVLSNDGNYMLALNNTEKTE